MEWYWIVLICVGACAVWLLLSAALYKQFFKRFYDIVLSALAIIVLSPLLIVLTIIGAIAMKGNPFFVQKRPGRINKKTGQEKIISLLKFRTMINAKDENGNLLPDGDRLNKYGKLLRSTSLDELPSLLNILIGDLSIVGPRPLLVKYLPLYSDEQRRRHLIRPGLTGYAQVHGRNGVNWDIKFAMDLKYIEHISLCRDLEILIGTIFSVLKREGVTQVGQATMEDFEDYVKSKGRE